MWVQQKEQQNIKIIYATKFIKYLPKYKCLGYGFLVNVDLNKISVLLVYNILRFENTDAFLNWDDDVIEVLTLSNNSKNINF